MKLLWLPLSIFYEKTGASRNFPKKTSRIWLFYNSALRRRTINPEKNKQTGFRKWFFNILLLFVVEILASYRLSFAELLCRINCCNIRTLKRRTVEWNEKSRPSVIKGHLLSRPLGIIFHLHMFKYYKHFWHALNFNC